MGEASRLAHAMAEGDTLRVDVAACVLTDQQLSILRLAADGKSNELIGAELGIRPMYVQKIVVKIMDALGASTRTSAVAIALRRGLIT